MATSNGDVWGVDGWRRGAGGRSYDFGGGGKATGSVFLAAYSMCTSEPTGVGDRGRGSLAYSMCTSEPTGAGGGWLGGNVGGGCARKGGAKVGSLTGGVLCGPSAAHAGGGSATQTCAWTVCWAGACWTCGRAGGGAGGSVMSAQFTLAFCVGTLTTVVTPCTLSLECVRAPCIQAPGRSNWASGTKTGAGGFGFTRMPCE